MVAGLARVSIECRKAEFRFSSQNRTAAGIQTIASFVGQKRTTTRKTSPRKTDAGRAGTG